MSMTPIIDAYLATISDHDQLDDIWPRPLTVAVLTTDPIDDDPVWSTFISTDTSINVEHIHSTVGFQPIHAVVVAAAVNGAIIDPDGVHALTKSFIFLAFNCLDRDHHQLVVLDTTPDQPCVKVGMLNHLPQDKNLATVWLPAQSLLHP